MKKFLLLIIFIVAIFTGCGKESNTFTELNPDEAEKIIQTEKNILILDVRTPEEYNIKRIPNAVLLPLEEIEIGNLEPLKDKNQKILIYCRSGRRSKLAAKILVENGYTNVFEFGAIPDWKGEVDDTKINIED